MDAQEVFFKRALVWMQALERARMSGIQSWINDCEEQIRRAKEEAERAGYPVQIQETPNRTA